MRALPLAACCALALWLAAGASAGVPKWPAHKAGWQCIHAREGAWHDLGGPYYGGLQMTWGWEGLVRNAALLSPRRQMWVAERGLRRHWGARWAWLRQQWPRTYPPCARHF
jgi:hypothetical protein